MPDNNQPLPQNDEHARAWNEFAYASYAKVCARKHNLLVPYADLGSLTDEELERRTRLLAELAHLPPG